MKVGVGSQLASTKQGKNLQQLLKSAQKLCAAEQNARGFGQYLDLSLIRLDTAKPAQVDGRR